MPNCNPPRDVGKEIGRATSSPDVVRRAAKDVEDQDTEKRSGDPGIHEEVFGEDDDALVDDTDQADRQPDGGRRR